MKYSILFSLFGVLAVAPDNAFAESIESALKQCTTEQNSLQRLVCYDRVVKDIDQYSGLEEAIERGYVVPAPSANTQNAAVPAPRAPVEQANRQQSATNFGLEHKQPVDEEIESLTASIVELKETPRRRYVITLDNGMVWQQSDGDGFKLKNGQSVTIERGVLGAFYLSRSDLNRLMKVKRVE